MWYQIPEERKRLAILRQESIESNTICVNIASVRGMKNRTNYDPKGDFSH